MTALITTSNIHDKMMSLALKEAFKAYKLGEIPVGCVITDENNELVATGFNRTIIDNDPSAHAEIVALRKAGEKLQNYRLVNLNLYVTLEPCTMCSGAIIHARIKRVYFGAYDLKTGACGSVFNVLNDDRHNHKVEIYGGILKEERSSMLSDFFKARRKMQKEGRDWIVESGKERTWLNKD